MEHERFFWFVCCKNFFSKKKIQSVLVNSRFLQGSSNVLNLCYPKTLLEIHFTIHIINYWTMKVFNEQFYFVSYIFRARCSSKLRLIIWLSTVRKKLLSVVSLYKIEIGFLLKFRHNRPKILDRLLNSCCVREIFSICLTIELNTID